MYKKATSLFKRRDHSEHKLAQLSKMFIWENNPWSYRKQMKVEIKSYCFME